MPNNSPRRLVEFSRFSLDSNLAELSRSLPDSVIDLRCDAYGHGASWVREAALAHGFDEFLDDDRPYDDVPACTGLLFGVIGGSRVATLSSEVVATKMIASGEHVSYGYSWTAERETRLGLVSLGFADGLPRAGSNQATMTLAGKRVQVVGRIAMDQCVVDITDTTAEAGDIATVWDTRESLAEWAECSARDPLSLVSGLSWRVERSWVS